MDNIMVAPFVCWWFLAVWPPGFEDKSESLRTFHLIYGNLVSKSSVCSAHARVQGAAGTDSSHPMVLAECPQRGSQDIRALDTLNPYTVPVPPPWHSVEPVGKYIIDVPSNTGLALRLNHYVLLYSATEMLAWICTAAGMETHSIPFLQYVPPVWRGCDPDKHPLNERPSVPDRVWEDPFSGLPPLPQNAPTVLGPSALDSLALPAKTTTEPKPKTKGKKNAKNVASSTTTTSTSTSTTTSTSTSKTTSKRTSKTTKKQKEKNAVLTSFGFTQAFSKVERTVAGLSTKFESLGIPKHSKQAPFTDAHVDRSIYLWPSYLFPELDDPALSYSEAFEHIDLQLVGLEYDARDTILDLKNCFL
ncbi:hypothetical protein B0H10DRAFT_1937715 [Mycena sp. CBHHK59/15]|nr:hypothetical protein B0H10DRAFT_1937715 [Mycena sp. CBHHK59/15]